MKVESASGFRKKEIEADKVKVAPGIIVASLRRFVDQTVRRTSRTVSAAPIVKPEKP